MPVSLVQTNVGRVRSPHLAPPPQQCTSPVRRPLGQESAMVADYLLDDEFSSLRLPPPERGKCRHLGSSVGGIGLISLTFFKGLVIAPTLPHRHLTPLCSVGGIGWTPILPRFLLTPLAALGIGAARASCKRGLTVLDKSFAPIVRGLPLFYFYVRHLQNSVRRAGCKQLPPFFFVVTHYVYPRFYVGRTMKGAPI